MEQLKTWILTELPNYDKWWKKANGETFVKSAETLHKLGVPTDTIKKILDGLYWTVSGEYGC